MELKRNVSAASTWLINTLCFKRPAPWQGGGENRGYSFWGKLVAEKENRPLVSVGKVRGDGMKLRHQNGARYRMWGCFFILIKSDTEDCKVCKVCKHDCWPTSKKVPAIRCGWIFGGWRNEITSYVGYWQRVCECRSWNEVLRNETRNGNDEMNMPAWKYM